MDSTPPTLSLDYETDAPDAKPELRLWLRLLTCTTLIEGEVRARLRRHFGVTLPQFDLMAQLDKAPDGLSMGELSRRMMVTNGNVTGIAERLAADGLVTRAPGATDRRTQVVKLTPAGRRRFRTMAQVHEGWIADLLGDLDHAEVAALMDGLGHAKQSVRAHRERSAEP
ncbi:MAG: MarR family transcriptional regulator [Inquilinus sp.]|nr:MarR family transcriptional regulator [Inquilinus sp.]